MYKRTVFVIVFFLMISCQAIFAADQGEDRVIELKDIGMDEPGLIKKTQLEAMVKDKVKPLKFRLESIKTRLSHNKDLVDSEYIQAGVAIAERFITRLENYGLNGPDGKQQPRYALTQLEEIQQVLEQTAKLIELGVEQGIIYRAPKPTGEPYTIRDGILYTKITMPGTDKPVTRPYYYYGYCGWHDAVADIEFMPIIGSFLISNERGPSALPLDGRKSDPTGGLAKMFQRADARGLKIPFLLSPHYFPMEWAKKKSPDIDNIVRANLPQFNIDDPVARDIIKQWIETVVPKIKDESGLLSFDLANEPTYYNSGRDKYGRPLWISYLKKQHKSIKKLNELYGSEYKSFSDVPVPDKDRPEGTNNLRAYYDWVRFNQVNFSGWIAWMDGLVKKHAPDVPTHTKIMAQIFNPKLLKDGVDPEMMCLATDFAGNDAYASWPGKDSKRAYGGAGMQCWYDLLHSFNNQPVIDDEFHFITDSEKRSIPAQYVRSVVWQGALHHRVAAALWVWAEVGLYPEPLSGSIYFRPACMYAAGRTMFDINRLSEEVAAISTAKASVGFLYSFPSIFWEGGEGWFPEGTYWEQVVKIREALNFMGVANTFVSERQLKEGKASEFDVIILPRTTHVLDSTIKPLQKFIKKGGVVLMASDEELKYNQYHQSRTLPKAFDEAVRVATTGNSLDIGEQLKPIFAGKGIVPVPLYYSDGKPAWDIECRLVKQKDRTLVSMMNFLREPQTVSLKLDGYAKDLVSLRSVDLKKFELASIEPVMLEIRDLK